MIELVGNVVWPACMQRFGLGNKTELLVAVRQPEGQQGPTNVTLITDQPAGMVMHWGVKQQGKGEWVAPPKDIIPKGSEQASDIAYDTHLEASDSVEVQGDRVQLQKAVIDIPAGHDLTGLTFVCKSQDGTMWWKDGMLQLCPHTLLYVYRTSYFPDMPIVYTKLG